MRLGVRWLVHQNARQLLALVTGQLLSFIPADNAEKNVTTK